MFLLDIGEKMSGWRAGALGNKPCFQDRRVISKTFNELHPTLVKSYFNLSSQGVRSTSRQRRLHNAVALRWRSLG